MSDNKKQPKIWILIVAIIVMAILHQDFWLWENTSLVFGFIPVGLFYHICYSIAASLLAVVTIIFFWPQDVEE